MYDTLIVEQEQRPLLAQGETLPVAPVEFEDAAFSAAYVLASRKQDGHKIRAVPVRAFRRRSSDAIAGVDTKLVQLHMPGMFAFDSSADLRDSQQQFRNRRLQHKVRLYRLEHAQHAAMQRVVFQRLE